MRSTEWATRHPPSPPGRRVVMFIDGLHALGVAILDLIARRGPNLWSWLVSCRSTVSVGGLHLSPITFTERAAVAADLLAHYLKPNVDSTKSDVRCTRMMDPICAYCV